MELWELDGANFWRSQTRYRSDNGLLNTSGYEKLWTKPLEKLPFLISGSISWHQKVIINRVSPTEENRALTRQAKLDVQSKTIRTHISLYILTVLHNVPSANLSLLAAFSCLGSFKFSVRYHGEPPRLMPLLCRWWTVLSGFAFGAVSLVQSSLVLAALHSGNHRIAQLASSPHAAGRKTGLCCSLLTNANNGKP